MASFERTANGNMLTADKINELQIALESAVNKTVLADVTNTTNAAVDVTDMSFNIGATERWTAEFYLQTGCSSTGGIKYAISVPTGSVFRAVIDGSGSSATSRNSAIVTASGTLTTAIWNNVAAATGFARISLSVVAGVNAGVVQLRFASNTAGQTSTIFSNSYLVARKVF
jgi:hypothetical protein